MATLDELKTKMASAIANNDAKAIEEIAIAIAKSKNERVKAEAEQARIDAEKMAGAREVLAKEIHKAVKALKLDARLREVKSWGFVYKVDKANPAEPDITYGSVSLSTATVKVKRTGAGGGATGKSKDEFGMSLTEIFDKFATDEDKKALAEAKTNSAQWQVKNKVKKQAIAEGKLKPAK